VLQHRKLRGIKAGVSNTRLPQKFSNRREQTRFVLDDLNASRLLPALRNKPSIRYQRRPVSAYNNCPRLPSKSSQVIPVRRMRYDQRAELLHGERSAQRELAFRKRVCHKKIEEALASSIVRNSNEFVCSPRLSAPITRE
jgi:hypothetical protein